MSTQEIVKKESDSICPMCAEKIGGFWPKGHTARHYFGYCNTCNQLIAFVTKVGNWSWPDNVRVEKGRKEYE